MEHKNRGRIRVESWYSEVQWAVARYGKLWRPPTDVYETDRNIVIKVELAGMAEGEFTIEFEGANLVIGGTRRDGTLKLRYKQMEIFCGEFRTSVRVEELVERTGLSYSYKDGFLVVVLPKRHSQAER
jgi:HSP20 family protein